MQKQVQRDPKCCNSDDNFDNNNKNFKMEIKYSSLFLSFGFQEIREIMEEEIQSKLCHIDCLVLEIVQVDLIQITGIKQILLFSIVHYGNIPLNSSFSE